MKLTKTNGAEKALGQQKQSIEKFEEIMWPMPKRNEKRDGEKKEKQEPNSILYNLLIYNIFCCLR